MIKNLNISEKIKLFQFFLENNKSSQNLTDKLIVAAYKIEENKLVSIKIYLSNFEN